MLSLEPFKTIITTADANAKKYKGDDTGNYTTWTPKDLKRLWSEGEIEDEYWLVDVERWTLIDPDPIVAAIETALKTAGIPFTYQVEYDRDTEYLQHIFSCIVRN